MATDDIIEAFKHLPLERFAAYARTIKSDEAGRDEIVEVILELGEHPDRLPLRRDVIRKLALLWVDRSELYLEKHPTWSPPMERASLRAQMRHSEQIEPLLMNQLFITAVMYFFPEKEIAYLVQSLPYSLISQVVTALFDTEGNEELRQNLHRGAWQTALCSEEMQFLHPTGAIIPFMRKHRAMVFRYLFANHVIRAKGDLVKRGFARMIEKGWVEVVREICINHEQFHLSLSPFLVGALKQLRDPRPWTREMCVWLLWDMSQIVPDGVTPKDLAVMDRIMELITEDPHKTKIERFDAIARLYRQTKVERVARQHIQKCPQCAKRVAFRP